MAFERKTELLEGGEDLASFVNATLNNFKTQLSIRNAEDEGNFARLILENNLSLDDQLAYRKEQLRRAFDDPDERRRIRNEISVLKDRIEAKKFSDDYLKKIIEVNSGISSIDTLLDWLQTRKDANTDINIKATIDQAIAEQTGARFKLQQEALTNQTNFAINDKSISLIDSQMEKISAAKSKALLAGNTALSTTYDLQLQALDKAKKESSIMSAVTNFAVSTLSGASSATGLLDAYNQKIGSAAASGPITIGGTTYNSERDFWVYKRDSYISDDTNNGFFSRLNTEYVSGLKAKNSANLLTNSDISNAKSQLLTVASRPELQPFLSKIQNLVQSVVQAGVDLRADSVINTYAKDLDLTKASNNLNQLKALGANVETAETKVILSAAETKTAQVSNIISAAQDLIKGNPNMTVEEAINQAVKAGAGTVVSPVEATTKTEAEIAQEATQTAQEGTGKVEERTTIQQPPAAPPAVTPAPTPQVKITSQFDLGARDPQVMALQKFLNAQGFKVSETGAGAPGAETDFFGPATQAALQKFQAAKGIVTSGTPTTTGFGRLGPKTLAEINKILGV